jgi:hypothetical protein
MHLKQYLLEQLEFDELTDTDLVGDLNEALWLKHSALVANEIHALEEMLEKVPSKKI